MPWPRLILVGGGMVGPKIGAMAIDPVMLVDGWSSGDGGNRPGRPLVVGCGVVAGGAACMGRSSSLTSESESPHISVRRSFIGADRTDRIGLLVRRRGGVAINMASFF